MFGKNGRLGVLGAGQMAEALVRGLLRRNLLEPGQIDAVDVDERRLAAFAALGARAGRDAGLLARDTVVLLAVKPQQIADALRELSRHLPEHPDTLFISIAAGVSSARVAKALPPGARVVRAMPNLPMLTGHGAAGIARGPGATAADMRLAVAWFEAAGAACEVEESELDAVTAVSGSGPAYVFLLAEALARAGTAAGLAPELAEKLARATIVGAGATLADNDVPAAEWRRRVTSPGGTTEAALRSFAGDGFEAMVARAVQAARRRGEELGKAAENAPQ